MSFSSHMLSTIAQKAAEVRKKAELRELYDDLEKAKPNLTPEDYALAVEHCRKASARAHGVE